MLRIDDARDFYIFAYSSVCHSDFFITISVSGPRGVSIHYCRELLALRTCRSDPVKLLSIGKNW